MMRLLVTAGGTQVPIDRVRAITNVATGRTGARIAAAAHAAGHAVTLLTSRAESPETGGTVERYRTFDELAAALERHVRTGYDAIIHSAAVSDYRCAGVYRTPTAGEPVAGAKIKSGEPELWLRLVPTSKLVDKIRADWGFIGTLVMFKLEVGLGDDELLTVAEATRLRSRADLVVANTLECAADWAFLGPFAGHFERVARGDLPERIVSSVAHLTGQT